MDLVRNTLMLELASEGVWDWDLEQDRAYLSPRYCELVGYAPEDTVFDRAFFEGILHPEDRAAVCDAVDEALAGNGELTGLEYRMVCRDGTLRWMEGRGKVVEVGPDGRARRMMGTVREITRRKQAEERLRLSEERFRSIMALSPDIISIIGADGLLSYNSPAALKVHGYREEDLLGRSTFELIHPEDQAAVSDALARILSHSEEQVAVQYRYLNRDGSYAWMEATACNQLENPLIQGIVCISRDIRERKELEDQRLNLERQLLHAQKLESLGTMAGGIAHDFNNLLAVIVGNLDLALLKLAPGADAAAHLEQAIQASRNAADLTRQILAYSGKAVFTTQPLDLNELVVGNVALFRAVIPRQISLEVRSDSELPKIRADRGQLQQVLMNLISNAVEAIGSRPGKVWFRTGVVEVGDPGEPATQRRLVYLEVADDGCGMSEETQRRFCEPFYTTKFTGRGLGMAAAQGIVKAHQGSMQLESREGEGTRLRILFPVAEPVAEAPELPARPAPPVPAAAPAHRGTVLVVDDEPFVRALGLEYLSHVGFHPLEAANGREAVELFRRRADEICLVLLDLTMPELDGAAAFLELKRIRPEVPVILCSGFCEEAVVQLFEGERPEAFLQKPFQVRELERTIAEVLA